MAVRYEICGEQKPKPDGRNYICRKKKGHGPAWNPEHVDTKAGHFWRDESIQRPETGPATARAVPRQRAI